MWGIIFDGRQFLIQKQSGLTVATIVKHDNDEDYARRIVACLNACNGIGTEILEKIGPLLPTESQNAENVRLKSKSARLTAEKEILRDALDAAEEYWMRGNPALIEQCKAALAIGEEKKPEAQVRLCEGECSTTNECTGDVKVVGVSRDGWEPFLFSYCETAISRDKSQGFTVSEI